MNMAVTPLLHITPRHAHGQLHIYIFTAQYTTELPIPVAAQSKVWACSCSIAGIVGLNPAGGMDVCLLCMLCVVR